MEERPDGTIEYTTEEKELMKIQYSKLSDDWRHFNNIIWGVPSVAVAIMTGVILAPYNPDLQGWPRITYLGVGSLFLFALTIELVKKRLHMNAISFLLISWKHKSLDSYAGKETRFKQNPRKYFAL